MHDRNILRFFFLSLAACGSPEEVGSAQDEVEVLPPGPRATLEIHRHHSSTGAQLTRVDHEILSAGWTFVREFHSGSRRFLFLLKRSDGAAQVWELGADGARDTLVESYSLPANTTSVALVHPNDQPVLLLHERQRGRLSTWSIASDGRITGKTSDRTRAELQYKDEIRPYLVGSTRYILAVDRWYGAAAILPLSANGTLSATAPPILDSQSWTTGWSAMTSYRTGNQTYLVLYKIDGGQIGVKRFNADGSLPSGWIQESNWNSGFTEILSEDSKLFMYRSDTGKLVVRELGSSGVGAVLTETNIGSGWTSLATVMSGGSLYLAKLNEEGRVPFDFQMAKRFRDVVVQALGGGKTAGYQLGLMQSGKVVMLHADGWAHRSESRQMSTKSKQSVASVSKMVTAVSTLRLIDEGEVEWNDRFTRLLPVPTTSPHTDYYYLAGGDPRDPTISDIRISELLTYTARFGDYSTGNVLSKPRAIEFCDPNHSDASWSAGSRFRCDRKYQNSAFGIAGFSIAAHAGLPLVDGTEDPEAFDAHLEDLWMREAFAEGMVCGRYDLTAYYEACDTGADCIGGFREFLGDAPRYCSSGNWVMSAEDGLQLLASIRYGRGLSDASTDLLFSLQKDRDGSDMTVGWDGSAELDGGRRYGKSGGSDGVKAYVMHFPRGVDAVVFTNTSPCQGCGGVKDALLDGYQAAIAP